MGERLAQRHAFGLLRRRPGFDSRESVWVGVSVTHICGVDCPLEQGDSSALWPQTDMALDPQATNRCLRLVGCVSCAVVWLCCVGCAAAEK